ncbi:hypothetical protein INT48_001113 [Thamnidium elegans]|uniref:Uncharacterized protein n=1 Tax=Thamnidium elegans TaxID=101142 RepID=A0A8H7SNJ3_9FUNG|nr:hypothetical protein INT48_001113 [Thamnidium elegans]
MSLNFFKSTPQKTDASLEFKTVLSNLKEKNDTTPLDIDKFIQQENVNLGSHQEFYKETVKDTEAPLAINENNQQTKENTRLLVNTLLELTKTMPELKSKAIEYNEKVEVTLEQNNQTIDTIQSINL